MFLLPDLPSSCHKASQCMDLRFAQLFMNVQFMQKLVQHAPVCFNTGGVLVQSVPEGLHFLFHAGTFPEYFTFNLNTTFKVNQQLCTREHRQAETYQIKNYTTCLSLPNEK